MMGRSTFTPSSAMARIWYSPPCTPSGISKSLVAVPNFISTRFLSTTAPLGLTSS
jgi:hypothetical protein